MHKNNNMNKSSFLGSLRGGGQVVAKLNQLFGNSKFYTSDTILTKSTLKKPDYGIYLLALKQQNLVAKENLNRNRSERY